MTEAKKLGIDGLAALVGKRVRVVFYESSNQNPPQSGEYTYTKVSPVNKNDYPSRYHHPTARVQLSDGTKMTIWPRDDVKEAV